MCSEGNGEKRTNRDGCPKIHNNNSSERPTYIIRLLMIEFRDRLRTIYKNNLKRRKPLGNFLQNQS